MKPLRTLAVLALGLGATGCGETEFKKTGKKLTVIGIDGMDPNLLRNFIEAGLMPNFAQLASEGTFVKLGTSNPPQSPVAWSNFITGENPGGHGVVDFIHRDPETYLPFSSTQTAPEASNWNLPGRYIFPSPFAEEPEKVQQGTPFWETLEGVGVECGIYRIPAAYPLTAGTSQVVLSDMGTPDLQGGIDGIYSFYSSTIAGNDKVNVGKFDVVTVDSGVVRGKLYGPAQPFYEGNPLAETPFKVYLDPARPHAYIEIDGQPGTTLKVGEWSEWCEVSFSLGLGQSVGGIVQFYLKELEPDFKLYASPVNIDPLAPASPISLPDDDSIVAIAEETGRFYTQGLAEETKALEEEVLTDAEFLAQCDVITAERMRMLDYALDHFDDGLLFFYFSSVDLRCHMMFRHITDGHPAGDVELARLYQHSIRDAYLQMDKALGLVRERLGPDAPVVVMSDHGFAPFLRKMHVNRWLYEEGYLVPTEAGETALENGEPVGMVHENIDWTKTKAYALGFNGLYLNLKGRERDGIVDPADRNALCEEIRGKLLALEDADRPGRKPILRVDLRDEIYQGRCVENAPDMIVGFAREYGASDETALGDVPKRKSWLIDNKAKWSGNHLMAPEVVPGVLVTNLPVQKQDPDLLDMYATLLQYFDVELPETARGRPIQLAP